MVIFILNTTIGIMRFGNMMVFLLLLIGCNKEQDNPDSTPKTCPCFPERTLLEYREYNGDHSDSTVVNFSYGDFGPTKRIFRKYWQGETLEAITSFEYEHGELKKSMKDSSWSEIRNDSLFRFFYSGGKLKKDFMYHLIKEGNKVSYRFYNDCEFGQVPVSEDGKVTVTYSYDLRGNVKNQLYTGCPESIITNYEISEDYPNPFFSIRNSYWIVLNGPNLRTGLWFGTMNLDAFIKYDITVDSEGYPIEIKNKSTDHRIFFMYE